LHGGSGSWNHWIRTIPALYDDYAVWVADLPGLGDSAMPPLPHTPQSCANVVADGIREFVSVDDPATLICFSFGCHVGTLAAATLADRLDGLFIIGSAALGLGRPPSLQLPKVRSVMNEAERMDVHRGVLANLMFADASKIDDQAVALQAQNISGARFRSREFAGSSDVRDGLAEVPLPLSSIWGGRDVVAWPDVNACLQTLALHHPELRHQVIEGAGHWVMYEAADAFNAALRTMLQDAAR
jgi:pimeloyl-ACP methyl ester carboxylesterase